MVTTEAAQSIARNMIASGQEANEVQIAQTLFRMQLVESWQIPSGARVLEIGCGQGDMTAVLAQAVGDNGHVTAVDRAGPEYGAPVSLGQAAQYLKASPLGKRIDFHFHYDVLDESHTFVPDTFDFVVLAHCSWYFDSLDYLRRTLQRVRPWARTLCYSEWDMEPRTTEQVPHLLAVLIQGQIEAYNSTSTRNVRTPFSSSALTRLLLETGWVPSVEDTIDTGFLKDADWEIEDCLRSCEEEMAALELPTKLQEFLGSQLDTLRSVASRTSNPSLPSYWIMARRSSDNSPD